MPVHDPAACSPSWPYEPSATATILDLVFAAPGCGKAVYLLDAALPQSIGAPPLACQATLRVFRASLPGLHPFGAVRAATP